MLSRSPISAAVRSGIWKKVASLSSLPGRAIPYFTTDTAAALRAVEIGAQVLLMAKNGVDGVYSADPRHDPAAERFAHITYLEALRRNLRVMDASALSLCMDNGTPIIVFDLNTSGNIVRAVLGDAIGTIVSGQAVESEERTAPIA